MSGLLGASWVRFYFALAGLLVLGFVFASQALARGAGAGAPLLTTTPTNTFTPTSTFTPVTGVTATPSCCDDLSATGVVTCSVEDPNYHYTYTVDNDCTDTRYGTFFVYLQNAPSVDGPWDLWTTSMFPVTLPPGRTQYSGNMYVDPAPPDRLYYRTQVFGQGENACWNLSFFTDPQPICYLSTRTPTPTRTRTNTPVPTPCRVIDDAITMSDLTQPGMFNVGFAPSSCGFSNSCPGEADTILRHVDRHHFYMPFGSVSTECVTVRVTATGCPGNIYSYALGGSGPDNLCLGYAGGTGDVVTGTTSYSFSVFRGTSFTIVVNEVVPNTGCSAYRLELTTDMGCSGIGTLTPTPSSTWTSVPTYTGTVTNTSTGTSTFTNTPTDTPTASNTGTNTAGPTNTAVSTVTPTWTPTRTPTGTPASGAALVGHVTWQGIAQPNSRNTTETLALTLRAMGGGPLAQYANLQTDASGFFTVPVETLPVGTYNYQAKGPRNLANGGQVMVGGGPVANVEMGLMSAGDASNDNAVNSIDFAMLRSTFGKPFCFCSDYDARADFNNTDSVDSSDFALLKGNFGHGGAPPVGP